LDSRLTTLAGLPTPSAERVPGAAFRRVGEKVLLVSEAGDFSLLSEADFRRWLEGGVADGEPLAAELAGRGLDRRRLDFQSLARGLKTRHLLDWAGPLVHTVVVTRRCNFKCLYCHASVLDASKTGADMTLETARRTVDFIFSTPNPELMIEFQGGEPLLNWPVVRFIAAYARRRAKWEGRKVHLALISNFSLLDEEKIRFLAEQQTSFCTSLDGPEDLHNSNRLYLGGNSHAQVVAWIRRLQELRASGLAIDPPNAICTVTKQSLGRAREIVDQAVELGLERIQLGPLDPIGFARKAWDKIGYEPEAFADFYRSALGRVIELNRGGVRAYEKTALILLLRTLRGEHWRFPNGDAVCRLAYGHDGGIYTSEEGRLSAHEGDESFRIGEIGTSDWPSVLEHPAVRVSMLAQNRYAQPLCGQCAYAPFCTVAPVANYRTQGSHWGRMPENAWCRTIMGVFDALFERLSDPDDRKILESWLEYRDR
jgi:His-Xaa-Ser system radical SAM maturase HxsB